MKKKIALLLSVAMLTASLAGCGGKSGSTSAPAGDSGSATTEAGGTAAGGHKDTLVIGTDADINNLDLQQQQDQIALFSELPQGREQQFHDITSIGKKFARIF